ncbi:Uncharacterised protein [Salmonella enterica subsp. enterica serovar Bovismorbificans]|uniref:Uncharacterized protein n=1 Tax=Salmonella enterica subsp. enterica serovar Bovismorbificans TaxID=58097 RepID=A0A655CKT2_SALET|nr:Uncharacterised protein [Salmonella enterica subsp. enterica serovar Bovismorbificans]
MIAFEWRRHGNQVRIGLNRCRRRTQKAAFHRHLHHIAQRRLHDVNFTAIYGVYRMLVDIHADNLLLAGSKSGRSR